jgi:very-short-patch-repair endonuclease
MERSTNANVMNARALRRSMSPPERLLWQALCSRPGGLKFRRQHPMSAFTADFYCPALKLVIEVDGDAHDMGDNPERDVRRDTWMQGQGLRVMRFTASDVMKDLQSVVSAITRDAWR